jgi:hypothetical protein
MNRTRLAVGIAIPVLLAVVLAILLLQGRHPVGEAAPATTAAPVTTVPPPTTTRAEPPKATGEDWLVIMREILSYRHSLYENPRPNLLDQIYDRRCPCYAREHQALSDLRRRGLRYHDEGVQVLRVKLLARAKNKPSDVAVEVLVRPRAQVLLNNAGQLVERTPASNPTYQDYELLRGPDGRWRVLFELPVPSGRSK